MPAFHGPASGAHICAITAQAKSLADAAVQLWRLAVYIKPKDLIAAKLLASATAAVERATQKSA